MQHWIFTGLSWCVCYIAFTVTVMAVQIASLSQAAGSSAGTSVGATAVQLSVRELDLHGSLSAVQRMRSASCSVLLLAPPPTPPPPLFCGTLLLCL